MAEPQSARSLADVAVVTVTYNSSEILETFLRSLRDSEPEPVQVVVSDNASADSETTARISRKYDATLHQVGSNRGYGGAINAAAQALGPEINWILVVNPDVTFTPGAISTMVEAASAEPSVGAVGPRIVDAAGTIYPSARQLPSLRTGIGHAVFVKLWPGNPWTRAYLADRGPSTEKHAVGWLSGACVLVRREAFDRLGGFDDGYFMYFEDVDLGYRLGRAGWLNVYVPQAVVEHTGAHSTTKESGRMLRAHHDSAYRYLSRKYSAWYLAPLRVVLRMGLWVRGSLLALSDKIRR